MKCIAEGLVNYNEYGNQIHIHLIKHYRRYYIILSEHSKELVNCSRCKRRSKTMFMLGEIKICSSCLEDFVRKNYLETFDNEKDARERYNYYRQKYFYIPVN